MPCTNHWGWLRSNPETPFAIPEYQLGCLLRPSDEFEFVRNTPCGMLFAHPEVHQPLKDIEARMRLDRTNSHSEPAAQVAADGTFRAHFSLKAAR